MELGSVRMSCANICMTACADNGIGQASSQFNKQWWWYRGRNQSPVQDHCLRSTCKRFQEFILVQSPRRWIQWHIHLTNKTLNSESPILLELKTLNSESEKSSYRDTSGQFNACLVRFVSRVEEQNLIPWIYYCIARKEGIAYPSARKICSETTIIQ